MTNDPLQSHSSLKRSEVIRHEKHRSAVLFSWARYI
jgi:hypothetical protein